MFLSVYLWDRAPETEFLGQSINVCVIVPDTGRLLTNLPVPCFPSLTSRCTDFLGFADLTSERISGPLLIRSEAECLQTVQRPVQVFITILKVLDLDL